MDSKRWIKGENARRKFIRQMDPRRMLEIAQRAQDAIDGKPLSPLSSLPQARKTPPDSYSFVKDSNPYVQRREIWETLKKTGLSINAAAQLLGRGKQFRKWANTLGAPNQLTRVTWEELRKLEGVDLTKTKRPVLII